MSIKINKAAFADTVVKASKPVLRRKATRLGEMMVQFAPEIVADEFVTDRPPNRRRTSDIHLVNAFKYEIKEESGGRVVSILTIKRGVSDVKVRVMNNGAAAHIIEPQGQFLKFPGFVEGFTGRRTGVFNAYSSDVSARARRVYHPGRSGTARGTRFMQRARARALKRLS